MSKNYPLQDDGAEDSDKGMEDFISTSTIVEGYHPPALLGLASTVQGRVLCLSGNFVAASLYDSQESSVGEYDMVWNSDCLSYEVDE